MKKLKAVFIILAIILLIALIVYACSILLNNESISPNHQVTPSTVPGSTDTPTPIPTATNTAAPTPTPTPEPTPEPTDVPDVTAKPPVTPTPSPTATPEPSEPSEPFFGSFRSDSGSSLNLRADYKYMKNDSTGKYDVTVSVYLEFYTINVSAKTDSTLKINDKEIIYNTEAMKYSDRVFHQVMLIEYTFEAERNEDIDVSARWNFRGKYSGVQIDYLEAAGSFKITR